MADVFISYKRDDRARAERIASKLQALGLEVWFDARIPSGVAFDARIDEALRAAKAVLVLWSPGSVESEWVRNEASVAKDRGILVALMVKPCELPIAFRSTQYEPLFESSFPDDDASWIKTVERVKDLVGSRDQVDAKQRKMLRRRKVFRVLSWLIIWPVGGLLMLMAVSYALAPMRTVHSGPYGFFAQDWDRGYAYAIGTIDLEGERLPANHAEISCRRDAAECLEARAELRDGELSVVTDRRQIVRWDENVIVARSQSPCADVTVTIDRTQETVNTVRVRNQNTFNSDALCSWMNTRNAYRLVDGVARARATERQREPYYIGAVIAVLLAWTFFVIARIVKAIRK